MEHAHDADRTLGPDDTRFCNEYGQEAGVAGAVGETSEKSQGQRKYVTALFSDLSGYTALTARLDPEVVREVMNQVFREVSQVIARYEGLTEKFVGDAAMVLFGVPVAHEDDAVRAIKTAMEIHAVVRSIGRSVRERIGGPLSMHSGIDTGLVVTSSMDQERGLPGIIGDAINLASRIEELAGDGEILVGQDTYRQAEGHFFFQALDPLVVKGRTEPIQVYKVLSQKGKPSSPHRFSGLRSDFVGRKEELAGLQRGIDDLLRAKGKIFTICGDPGAGKSRLVEEFRASLDLGKIQWLEGHAYAYMQNVPYFPIVNLMNGVFAIEEGDLPGQIGKKIESGIVEILGPRKDLVPYVGSLYALNYDELRGISPEIWKSRLHAAVLEIMSGLTRKAPTVFFLEDLHWADPSSVDLLRSALLHLSALFVCAYRPTFSLSIGEAPGGIGKPVSEIRIEDLSPSETEDMLQSLLKTDDIPPELRQFVQDKTGGNPFFLEELVSTLIESENIIRVGTSWKTARPLSECEIPSTISGVITGRLDRLDKKTKRILQQASVIGRTFPYEILKRVTDFKTDIDASLRTLEHLDLIRRKTLQPEVEYAFRHALTQDVAYNGLLNKERQEIHQSIGEVVELLFGDRLPEFYETLAYHYGKGQSLSKAVDYLAKAGKKCLIRYSVEEAHEYYNKAYAILSGKPDRKKEDDVKVIDLLNELGLACYYRGDYKTLPALLTEHRSVAESLEDKSKLALYYCWLGMALFHIEHIKESYRYLKEALALGEELKDYKVIANASLWLVWICAEKGLLDEAIDCGSRAQEMAGFLESDDLYCLALAGLGQGYWYKGEVRKTFSTGQTLLAHSRETSNARGTVLGHYVIGSSHFMSGHFSLAVESYEKAISSSPDPYYSQWPRMLLCLSHVLSGRIQEAEETLSEVLRFTDTFGVEIIGTPARSIMGLVLIGKGHLREGMGMYEECRHSYMRKERQWCHALSEYILGTLYLKMARREVRGRVSAGNIFFLLKNLPHLRKKAERHLQKSVDEARGIGAMVTLGMACLNLGLLYQSSRKVEKARQNLHAALDVFSQCEAEGYLMQTRKALQSIGEVS